MPCFQCTELPGRSYTILIPLPQRASAFKERFNLKTVTELVIATRLLQYDFRQEPAKERFSEQIPLELTPGGDSIEAVIQGTIGRDTAKKSGLRMSHCVVVQIPPGSEIEVIQDIATGHYPFRSKSVDSSCLVQGLSLALTKDYCDAIWTEMDKLAAWGFDQPPTKPVPTKGVFTFEAALEQEWCERRSLAKFLTFLQTMRYPYLETGLITESGYRHLMSQYEARRADYKAKCKKTARTKNRRKANKTSLEANPRKK